MIKWSEEVRDKDNGYFCKAACENGMFALSTINCIYAVCIVYFLKQFTLKAPVKDIWIVSDIRRKTDLKWFGETYGKLIKTIRINADQSVREKRGWIFTSGNHNIHMIRVWMVLTINYIFRY